MYRWLKSHVTVGLSSVASRQCLIPEIINRSMITSGRSWRSRWVSSRSSCNCCSFTATSTLQILDPNQDWCCFNLWYQFVLSHMLYLFNLEIFINSLLNRWTSRTALSWSWSGMRCWRTRTDASCQWRGPTCWRQDCGWSLKEKKDWTMAVWPGSGSSSCPRRCSTRTTDCLSILPRESTHCLCLCFL